ncbi:MAG: hypothetical protein HN389_09910 [Clostridia bacterium]|jgi:hypothetical protein|nr:hypothetical protein [Clostridia bacterium]
MFLIKSKDIGPNIKTFIYGCKSYEKFVALSELPLEQIKINIVKNHDRNLSENKSKSQSALYDFT